MIVWGGYAHIQGGEKILRAAIERQLRAVMIELEARADAGRFPAIDTARAVLKDEAVEKRVHLSSLFDADDLWYNPSQPSIGGDADILCARVENRLFCIRANHQMRLVPDEFLGRSGFVALGSGLK